MERKGEISLDRGCVGTAEAVVRVGAKGEAGVDVGATDGGLQVEGHGGVRAGI